MDGTTRGQRIKEAREHWQSLATKGERPIALLVRLLGISEPTYYNWEGDKVADILSGNLMKFSKITGFHPNYLEHNKPPKMLSEDEAAAALIAKADGLDADDLHEVLQFMDFVRARKRPQTQEP